MSLFFDGTILNDISFKLTPLESHTLNLEYGTKLEQGFLNIYDTNYPVAWYKTSNLDQATLSSLMDFTRPLFSLKSLGCKILKSRGTYYVCYALPVDNSGYKTYKLNEHESTYYLIYRDMWGIKGTNIKYCLSFNINNEDFITSAAEKFSLYQEVSKWTTSVLSDKMYVKYLKKGVYRDIIYKMFGTDNEQITQRLDYIVENVRELTKKINPEMISFADYLMRRISNFIETSQMDINV